MLGYRFITTQGLQARKLLPESQFIIKLVDTTVAWATQPYPCV